MKGFHEKVYLGDRTPHRRWSSLLLVVIAILLAALGGLFAASQYFGIGLYAVAAPNQVITAPLKHGDIALVRKTATSKIITGELVGVRLSHNERVREGLPAQFVGKVVMISGRGRSRDFFVEADGKIASVIPSSGTGAYIGKIVELIPYAGFPLLFFSSLAGIITLEGFIFASLGFVAWALCKVRLRRSNVVEDLSLEAAVRGDRSKTDLAPLQSHGTLAHADTINRGTDSKLWMGIEKLLEKSTELRMAAEWSLLGELERTQLYSMLSETADKIDALKSQYGYQARNSEDVPNVSDFGTSVTAPVRPAKITRRKTPFVPSEKGSSKFAIHVVSSVAIAISIVYLLWRAVFTLAALWISIPFLLLEIWSFVDLILYAYSTWNVDPPEVLLDDGSALGCTVLIATYNEPVSILLPTVVAAAAMDFATETWVLDDGNRKEVEERWLWRWGPNM